MNNDRKQAGKKYNESYAEHGQMQSGRSMYSVGFCVRTTSTFDQPVDGRGRRDGDGSVQTAMSRTSQDSLSSSV